jgi:hypothetical protein
MLYAQSISQRTLRHQPTHIITPRWIWIYTETKLADHNYLSLATYSYRGTNLVSSIHLSSTSTRLLRVAMSRQHPPGWPDCLYTSALVGQEDARCCGSLRRAHQLAGLFHSLELSAWVCLCVCLSFDVSGCHVPCQTMAAVRPGLWAQVQIKTEQLQGQAPIAGMANYSKSRDLGQTSGASTSSRNFWG